MSPIDAANTGEKSPFQFCMLKGCDAHCDSPDLHEQNEWLGKHLQDHHGDAFAAIGRCYEHIVSCDPNADVCACCTNTVDLTCCVECYDAYCPQCVGAMEPADKPVDDLDSFWRCPAHRGAAGISTVGCSETVIPTQRLVELYTHAISLEEEDSMPMLGHTINRRCERLFDFEYTDDKLQSLICFSCARVLPHDQSDRARPVRWRKAYENGKFCGRMDREATENSIGFETYCLNYVPGTHRDPQQDAPRRELVRQLRAWKMSVPFAGGENPLDVLCCP